jgi:hypothetical protein
MAKRKAGSSVSKSVLDTKVKGDCISMTMQPPDEWVRDFRWTLESETLLPHYNKKLEIDWLNRRLKFQVYDVIVDGSAPTQQAREALVRWPASEFLTLRTYSGCGGMLDQTTFSGVKVISCRQTFDYASSEVADVEFEIEFAIAKVTVPPKA